MPPTNVTDFPRRTRTTQALETPTEQPTRTAMAWAAARILIGWVFLWAFLDKLLGLGFSTPAARAWLNGGSPTLGFLSNSRGALADVFKAMAGNPAVDALFMLGLLAVGVALILGIGMRIAAVSGGLMMLLMWAAAPPTTNPVVDSHIVYTTVLAALVLSNAGATWGLGERWARLPLVQRSPWLR